MSESKAVVPKGGEILPSKPDMGAAISPYASQSNFEAAQRMAKALAQSDIVPKDYKGNIANVLVAMELSARIGAGVLAVMQGVDVIHGRPAFRSQFKIASAAKSGRFSAIRYEWATDCEEDDDDFGCRAYATEIATGDILWGPWITWRLVKAEGWDKKSGSKWKTMAQKMFMYRAGSWWVDLYAPDISMGMMSSDEVVEADWEYDDGSETAKAGTRDKLQVIKEEFGIDHDPEEEVEPEPVPVGEDGEPNLGF